MTAFTNPASGTAEQAKAYITAVLDLLGTRNPMEVLESTPQTLELRKSELSVQQLNDREAPGKWASAHVIQHLADSELVWGYRLRMVLAEDRPELTGYDQDLWAERLRYEEDDVDLALEVFSALRRANLRLLKRASPAELARIGLHSERGEETVEQMLRLYAGHDLVHLRQLDRIRRVVTER